MRALTPPAHARPHALLAAFYARRIRSGRDLYTFHGLPRPGAASPRQPRLGFWQRLLGQT